MRIWNRLVDSLRARWNYTPRQRILMAFLDESVNEHVVVNLMRAAHVSSGTIYPVLLRLEDEKILQSRWEDDTTGEAPRRRLYKLTTDGETVAKIELLIS